MAHLDSGLGRKSVMKLKMKIKPLQSNLLYTPPIRRGHKTTDTSSQADTKTTMALIPCSPVAEYILQPSLPDPDDAESNGESIEVLARNDVAGVTLISSAAAAVAVASSPAASAAEGRDENTNAASSTKQDGQSENGTCSGSKADGTTQAGERLPSSTNNTPPVSPKRRKKKKTGVPNPFFTKLKQQKELKNKSCFFTGQTITGTNTYYYAQIKSASLKEPLQVYTLASSMKLIGCPTICDDDLKRIDKLYFAQNYRRLPEELRLSSSWSRVAKFCSFSGLPIPDGMPFYYARRRTVDHRGITTLGRYWYLRADVVWGDSGEQDSIDMTTDTVAASSASATARPLTTDDLMYLLSEYPDKCDAMASGLLQEPSEWTSISKFCHFSGGPIKSDDTYYKARLNGRDIYLLVVLSPHITPRELFGLESRKPISGKKSTRTIKELRKEFVPLTVKQVKNMENVYRLTNEDFGSLRRKHLGKYMELPDELIDPRSWQRVVPAAFLEAKEEALAKAREFEKTKTPSPLTEPQFTRPVRTSPTLALFNSLILSAKKGVRSMQCGSPESFSLKDLLQDGNLESCSLRDLLQDDESYLRELVENASTFDNDDDETSQSLRTAQAIMKRYASRVGVGIDDLLDGDSRLSVTSFDVLDEMSIFDNDSFDSSVEMNDFS